MNTFINFFIARASSTRGSWVCFKLKCLLYDNEYFLLTFLLPVPHQHRAQGFVSNWNVYYMTMNIFYQCVPHQQAKNKKSTKNKETHKSKQLTWEVTSLPCLILFLLPVALLNNNFFSPTLFSFALYRFKGMDYFEQLFLTHSFCPSIGSQYTMLIGLGQAGSGCRVRSGQVESGSVQLGHWVVGLGRVIGSGHELGLVQLGWRQGRQRQIWWGKGWLW